MDFNEILQEAQQHPNPQVVSSIYDLIKLIAVGDNLYVKRNNGDNLNLSVIEHLNTNINSFVFKVKKGKDTFNITAYETNPNTLYVEEYDPQTKQNQVFKYKDIQHITVSDKKVLRKSVYNPTGAQPAPPTQPNGNGQSQGNNQPAPPTQPNSRTQGANDPSFINKVLKRLGRIFDYYAIITVRVANNINTPLGQITADFRNLYQWYIKATQTRNGGGQNNGQNNTQNQSTSYTSLTQHMKWDGSKWVTTLGQIQPPQPQPQKISGNAKDIAQALSDVLFITKTGDKLKIVISTKKVYDFDLEVNNQEVKMNGNFAYKNILTNYKEVNIVRIANKNQASLSLYLRSITQANHLTNLDSIQSFIYTPTPTAISYTDIAQETFDNLKDSLKNLDEDIKIDFIVRKYTSPSDSTIDTYTIMAKKDKNGNYVIENGNVSELKGKSFNDVCLLPSVDEQSGDITGTVFSTLEGTAFGFIESIKISAKTKDGLYQDIEDENDMVSLTDEDLYNIVMSDPTLKDFVIKKPSFWQWMKHRKDNFRNVDLDAGYFKNIIHKMNRKGGDVDGYVTEHKFKLKVLDTNGLVGVYSNGYQISDGMSMLVMIKSSSDITVFHVFKTSNSKPSLVIKTERNVYDIKTNKLDNTFKGNVYDTKGQLLGQMLFTIN